MAKLRTAKETKNSNPAQPKKKIWPILFVIFVIFLILSGVGLVIRSQSTLRPIVAVIPVEGTIGVGDSADPDTIVRLIERADRDIAIEAIILSINSPGGSAVASEEIARAVRQTRKPVVAWIREVGASGAFLIAVSADKVVADPASITGSIGVVSSYLSFEKLMERYGITYNRLVTGEFKDTTSPFKELTPEERAYILEKLEVLKNKFVTEVAKDRNLSVEYVNSLADGKIWLGEEAMNFGMVDVLGGKPEAKKLAEQLAGIEDSRLIVLRERRAGLFDFAQEKQSLGYWIGRGLGDSLIEDKEGLKIET